MSTKKVPIGIVLPIANGNNGYFNQSFDTATQIKNNLYNFLNTIRGERRFFPEFGTKLYEVVFEQNDVNTIEIIKNIITEELSVWIPQISIKNIKIIDSNSDNVDNYKKEIRVDYIINSTQETDFVTFNMRSIFR